MKNEMSPLKVELLLWYYHSPIDFPNFDAPAVQDAIDDFCKAGIFRRTMKNEVTNRKIDYSQSALDAYVNEILSVPLPKQIWVCEK
jgi:hypothetical protein